MIYVNPRLANFILKQSYSYGRILDSSLDTLYQQFKNTNIVSTIQIVILVFSVIGFGAEVDFAGPEEATDSQASTRTPLGPGISTIFVNDGFPLF